MANKKYTYLVGDFETTVFDNQYATEVWASAIVELNTEDVKIFHSIDETYDYLLKLKKNLIVYYHNLKFDGEFWLSFMLNKLKLRPAIDKATGEYSKDKDMGFNTYTTLIANMGQWYSITIRTSYGKYIELRDSLKLLPFSVKAIGKSFNTKHQKLDMEYKGYRYAGCEITEEEKKYIANDVLVVKEAMEIMMAEGHSKLTIGSCCLSEFKKGYEDEDYLTFFPDLSQMKISKEDYGSETADEYIRKSYKGGWCYVVKGKENQIKRNGITLDVNSLYPSMMSSESGNWYPIGHPRFWKGNYIPNMIPENPELHRRYFFIRFKCRFKIKPNKLPFVQIKHNLLYRSTEMLETSSVYSKTDGKYHRYYKDSFGNIQDTVVELTMTETDWFLFNEHYEIYDLEILDGCIFGTMTGIFDDYIEKYKQLKMTSKGAKRQLAKLFLNNLYGKMATSPINYFRKPFLKEDNTVAFDVCKGIDKKAGDIAIGSAITSYARNFTIRTAQKNYYGKNTRGFIYADTDSIHCDLDLSEVKGVKIHDKNFCCWKCESCWDYAIFARQKTYIEHIVKEDMEDCNPHSEIKCAGMPEHCKNLLLMSIGEMEIEEDLNDREFIFATTARDITDFKKGLIVPGKLRPVRLEGGIVLADTTYEMR